MPIRVGNITLHMGPRQTGAPDDLEKAIVGFLGGAKKSLDIAVQEVDNERIARAILAAARRKVRVRLVLEADYLREEKARTDPWRAGGANEANRAIQDAVLRSALYVRSDFNPEIFHQKFVVRDGNAVLTGSTNFTDNDVQRNLNHVAVFEDPRVARLFAKEFEHVRQGRFGRQKGAEDPAAKPRRVEVAGVPVKVLFAPEHSPEMEIMKLMVKARERIDFAVFTFAQSSGIDDAMVRLAGHGMPVRGAIDAGQGRQKWASTPLLRRAGVSLRLVGRKRPVRKLHHKLMVLDRQVVVLGSFNYTEPANRTNDENIVVVGDLDTEDAASRGRQRRLAAYAFEEIDRILRVHGTPA